MYMMHWVSVFDGSAVVEELAQNNLYVISSQLKTCGPKLDPKRFQSDQITNKKTKQNPAWGNIVISMSR